MNKYIFIVLSIFSISSSAYIPMRKNKDLKFKDEVCMYSDGDYTYVKPCDEGKYCETSSSLSVGYCKNVVNKIKLKSINDECTSDFDCESNLECKSNKCLYSPPIACANNESPVRLANGNWDCKKDDYKGLCYYEKKEDSSPEYQGGAEYFQVCGKMTFDKSQEINGHIEYKPIKIESNYMGSVDDGEFVYDEVACKSGYALYFYADGSLINPGKTTFPNQRMFKKCVSINDFDKISNNCVIKYDNDKIYNVNKLSGKSTMTLNSPYTSSINTADLCNEPLIKKEMWNKYINLYTIEKQKECEKNIDLDDPLTCDDNEISKWYYFYYYPEPYIAYYDEKDKNNDVINYLLQNTFKRHISSGFLNIKLIICLLFLFLYI